MDEKALKRYSVSQVLLVIAAFLIPLIGGQVSTEAQPLEPGFGVLLRSMWGGPFLEGTETPLLSHFSIGCLIAAAMVAFLAKRSVLQLPNIRILGVLIGFFGLLIVSVGLSGFRFVSGAILSEWLLYALAFFTVVTAAGRGSGPRSIMLGLYGGCVLVALYGIRFEYLPSSATDPSWRIFAGWINPNALAGMLLIGLILGIALGFRSDRRVALITGIGNFLIGVALFLTGSKAGFGALLVGLIAYFILAIVWSAQKRESFKGLGIAAITVVLAFGAFTLLQMKAASQTKSGTANIGRLTAYGATADQSWTFRKLLWKGSVDLMSRNPIGYGVGTYRFEGSRPGLTTLTTFAHNSVLELGVEASPLAALLFVAFILTWLALMFRGARNMPDDINALRAGIVAAILATLAHGIFESNLYYFGIGLSLFILMGLGLNLSADSVVPEFTPKGARSGLAVLVALPILLMAYAGYAEWQRAQIRYAMENGLLAEAQQTAQGLVSLVPNDGEGWYLLHMVDAQRREEAIRKAASLNPSPRVMRAYAKFFAAQGQYETALDGIRQALDRDPNNLSALSLKMAFQRKKGDVEAAKATAQRMIAVEETPYFKIRSIAELVDTDTCDARLFLADLEKDPAAKVKLLEGAVELLRQYAVLTVPKVKQSIGHFAGETLQSAADKCQLGIATARRLEELYRLGVGTKSTDVSGAIKDLEGALASLEAK